MCCHVSRFSFGTRGERGYGEGSEDLLFYFGVCLFVCIEDWERETGTMEVGAGLEPA